MPSTMDIDSVRQNIRERVDEATPGESISDWLVISQLCRTWANEMDAEKLIDLLHMENTYVLLLLQRFAPEELRDAWAIYEEANTDA